MDKPDGSNATLRVNLMGEHSQRIKPQGNKPRRMDETSWQQPRLMGDNNLTAQPDGVYSRAYWGAATPTGFVPWRVGAPHGRTYWVSRA